MIIWRRRRAVVPESPDSARRAMAACIQAHGPGCTLAAFAAEAQAHADLLRDVYPGMAWRLDWLGRQLEKPLRALLGEPRWHW